MSPDIATTQWSQVLAARDGSDTEARRALEVLCQTYWLPLYAYVRHQGSSPEDARDLGADGIPPENSRIGWTREGVRSRPGRLVVARLRLLVRLWE